MNKTITAYYKNTNSLPPNPLLVKSLSILDGKNKLALDLGCGAGRDTRYLLDKGFVVTAVDVEPPSGEYINALPHPDKLQFICSSFLDFQYKKYDLINAHYSLPFSPSNNFAEVFQKIVDALNPGGVFIGQLFGIQDEWNKTSSNMSFHRIEDVKQLLSSLEVIEIKEINKDGTLADGTPKYWHVFNIVARKPKFA